MKRPLVSRPLVSLLLTVAVLGSLGWSKPRRQYLKVVYQNTQRSLIYHHLATALNGNVLLLTPTMRAAMIKERNRLLLPSADDQAKFEARMAEDEAGFHEVILSVDSSMRGGEQFGPGDGHWNLRMLVDGTQAELVAVEHVRRPTPLHRSLYAFHDQWSELWIARFTRVSDSPEAIELIISGGYGNDTVKWKL